MRLGILSDTHDKVERVRTAIALLREAGAEALVHCGDLASPPILQELAVLPSWFVFGNHDADVVPQLRQAAAKLGPVCLGWSGMIELSGHRLAVAHGHMSYDLRLLRKEQPNYLLSGHSHLASDRMEGSIRRINPGALHEADTLTVGLLDLTTAEFRLLPVTAG